MSALRFEKCPCCNGNLLTTDPVCAWCRGGSCSNVPCTGRAERHPSGEAGGLEAHTPACSGPRGQLTWVNNQRVIVIDAADEHRCGPVYCVECSEAAHDWVTWTPEHIAAAVRVWLTEALAAPEVVEAAACGIASPQLPNATSRRYATAALSAAADALRAGVTR